MTDKTQQLMDLYDRLAGPKTFTEPQAEHRGTVPTDVELQATLRRLVGAFREEYNFRTTLTDDDLVWVVRGFYDGDADSDVAAVLDVSPDVVSRARVNLHLVRDEDYAGLDPAALGRLIDAGHDDAAVATELGTTETAVRHARRAFEAERLSQRESHTYHVDFEEALGLDEGAIAASHRLDRRLFDEVHD